MFYKNVLRIYFIVYIFQELGNQMEGSDVHHIDDECRGLESLIRLTM